MNLKSFPERWSALAALRFVLAAIVACTHLPEELPPSVLDHVPKFGPFEAILGFLLISGYSIGASYAKEPDGFLQRRALRIYPVYLASLAVVYAGLAAGDADYPPPTELIANLLFLNQIVSSPSMIGPAWSLSLEVWLYALTPLLFTLSDGTIKRLAIASFLAYLFYTCGRTLFHWAYYAGTLWGLNLPLLAFVWLAGLRLARNQDDPSSVLKTIGWMFTLHMGLGIAIQSAARWKHGNFAALLTDDALPFVLQASTLAVVLLVFWRLSSPGFADASRPAKPSRWLRWLGDVSYPLYLVHIPVYFLLGRVGVASAGSMFCGALVASAVMHKTVDHYAQRRHAVRASPPEAAGAAAQRMRGKH